jgi:hypothetical protein
LRFSKPNPVTRPGKANDAKRKHNMGPTNPMLQVFSAVRQRGSYR